MNHEPDDRAGVQLGDEPGNEPGNERADELDQLHGQFAAAGAELLSTVTDAVPGWIVGCLARFEIVIDDQSLSSAVAEARSLVEPRLASLLRAPIDAQRSTPLAIIRMMVAVPTALLAAAAVDPVERDPFDERAFPDDVYAIAPATWADLGADVADAGLRWSVNKAFLHAKVHRSPLQP